MEAYLLWEGREFVCIRIPSQHRLRQALQQNRPGSHAPWDIDAALTL